MKCNWERQQKDKMLGHGIEIELQEKSENNNTTEQQKEILVQAKKK